MTLRSGERVLIRPIEPKDKDTLVDGFRRLGPESRYRRFFSPMVELGSRQLRYLTEVDHRTHEALIATDPSSGEGLGVARFVRSSTDPRAAEVAVVVIDSWQGRGLGTALLEGLAGRALEEGVERFTASVLADNSPMLELLRELGDIEVLDREPGVVELQIELRGPGVPAALSQTVRAAARGGLTVEPRHPVHPAE
ncbi:MAG: GNAT family N-acetyltransferase [Solirubrobacterales bacterium]